MRRVDGDAAVETASEREGGVTGARTSCGRAPQHLPRSGLVQRTLFPPNCVAQIACQSERKWRACNAADGSAQHCASWTWSPQPARAARVAATKRAVGLLRLRSRDMKGGAGAPHHGRSDGKPSGRRSPNTSSFSRPLVSTCGASPQIDEAADAQSVGDLLQAVAGRRQDAQPKRQAIIVAVPVPWGRDGDLAEERLPARCRRIWRA